MMDFFNIILFNDFETLDAFGPAEVIGKLEKVYNINYFSENGGAIRSSQNAVINTTPFSDIQSQGVLLIPGGFGTRREAENNQFIYKLRELCIQANFVLTVCTGSGLLAKTGLLKGKKATSNKNAFSWAENQDPDVYWIKKARWVKEGKFYTSSGVSAGIDMALAFVADTMGKDIAKRIACGIEYIWNEDSKNDPFSIQ